MALPAEAEVLAGRARTGDQAALEELLRVIRPEVVRRCGRFLPFREDAEDAAQEALLQVARRIGDFEGRSSFGTWLYVVVTNAARQTYRQLKRRAVPIGDGAGDSVLDRPDPRTTSVIAGSTLDLLDALDRLEASRPALVAPLVYRDVLGLDYAEIAARLDVPVGTVRSRLHEARLAVRPWLS